MGILLVADRDLSASQIIALAEPLGITPTNVKSSITRMVSDGSLASEGKARLRTYRPSTAHKQRAVDIGARLQRHSQEWDGSWVLVSGYSPKSRAQRERLHAAMWIDGFRWANGAFVRPAWPSPWAQQKGHGYADLMEGFCLVGKIEVSATDFESLYDLSDLYAQCARLADELQDLSIPESPRECYATLLRVGGQVVQLASHLPLLPTEVADAYGPDLLCEAYARVHRRLWPFAKAFLESIIALETRESAGLALQLEATEL